MVKHSFFQLALPLIPQDFLLFNLQVESSCLAKNRLKDPTRKHHFVLQSRKKKPQMVVFHLSGYFGNGSQSFQQKTLEKTFVEQLMEKTRKGVIPSALHVFVDSMTSWGGSQFINSVLFGNHSDHLQDELIPLVQNIFTVDKRSPWIVMGASSGGYGALHHVSLKKSRFSAALAIAPDSDFETSLIPEVYKMAPYLRERTSYLKVQKSLQSGDLQKQKNFFSIMNCLAMSACYSSPQKNNLQFPVDLYTGKKRESVWREWKKKDPVNFLAERAPFLRGKSIYLDVGMYDDFCLYFGARQIKDVLHKKRVPTIYSEFPGSHFGLNERKIKALEWLKKF